MSINDPILEMLSFAVENDLNLRSPPSPQPGPGPSSGTRMGSSKEADSTDDTTACKKSVSSWDWDYDLIKSQLTFKEDEENEWCLFPDCPVRISKQLQQEFLAHLLTKHKLVVENVDEIANWSKYLSYWRDRFDNAEITDFCVGFVMEAPPKPEETGRKRRNQGQQQQQQSDSGNKTDSAETVDAKTGTEEKGDMYFMLSPVLPEDSQLRKKLWKERLDAVLEVNRQEREEANFTRRCLFCREVITGNRTHYFGHMRDSHGFHIGQPDNLVYIKELIQLIEDKLNALQCLFCENTFKDKAVLKEHMRKKQHRQLNPKNREYDRFYVVNYLEPGKTWETIQLEDTEDDKKEDEWIEPTEEKERSIVCLFCKVSKSDFPTILEHMRTEHKFDFLAVAAKLDFYQKIKVVNYIRRTVYQNRCLFCNMIFYDNAVLLQHFDIVPHSMSEFLKALDPTEQWNRAEHFFPTYEDDDFLTCLDSEDNPTDGDVISSENDSNIIPEDYPPIYFTNRVFDLAEYAIRFHSQSS